MSKTTMALIVALVTTAATGAASAQQSPRHTGSHAGRYARNVPAALAAEAKVSEDSAVRVASSRVPKGQVRAIELERENGRLIYSLEMRLPGKQGVDEVNVDARDGALVGIEHENAKAEARERRADEKAKASAAKKRS